jgi:hypothetical protein
MRARPQRAPQLSAEERERRLRASVQSYDAIAKHAEEATINPFSLPLSQIAGHLEAAILLEEEPDVWGPAPQHTADDAVFALFSGKVAKRSVTSPLVAAAPPLGAGLDEARDASLLAAQWQAPRTLPVSRADWQSRDSLASPSADSSQEDLALHVELVTDGPVSVAEGSLSPLVDEDVALFSTQALHARAPEFPREVRVRSRPRDAEALRAVCVDGRAVLRDALAVELLCDVESAGATLPAVGTVISVPGECPPSPDRPEDWARLPARLPQHRKWTFVHKRPSSPPPISRHQLKRHPGLARKRVRQLHALVRRFVTSPPLSFPYLPCFFSEPFKRRSKSASCWSRPSLCWITSSWMFRCSSIGPLWVAAAARPARAPSLLAPV